MARHLVPLAVAVTLTAGACGGGGHHRVAKPEKAKAVPSVTTSSGPATSTSSEPVRLDPDVAALPDGHGARIAVVVDDVGGVDTYLSGYLALTIPITLSVIPTYGHATQDDAAITGAGKQVLLHIPLANRPGPHGVPDRGLGVGDDAGVVDRWLSTAFARVPHAVGANNHEGPYGSSSVSFMRELLGALGARHLFFFDSVTSQRTVGFALEAEFGMPPRINNVFLDHFENDGDSRAGLIRLARITSVAGGAIGICHVFHPYELHALQALAGQLTAKGYVFSDLSDVTDAPTADGLDRGVRTRI